VRSERERLGELLQELRRIRDGLERIKLELG
jgi:hypothetical protein